MHPKLNNNQLLEFLFLLKNKIQENASTPLSAAPTSTNTPNNNIPNTTSPVQSKKSTKVIFDKSSSPFEVLFSERGFLIDDTRMSFEELETAISKEYSIVLKNGSGLTLDAIKMQKILKYKDLY